MFQDGNKMCVTLCTFVVPHLALGMHTDARVFNLTRAPHTRPLTEYDNDKPVVYVFPPTPWMQHGTT